MYSTYRYGALDVVETPKDKNAIQHAIRQIDDRLFIEMQRTLRGEDVWCVVCPVGSDRPPITILEWRDENDEPIPHLASGLINRVERMERDGKRLSAAVMKANSDLIETQRRDTTGAYRDIVHDMQAREHRSAVLPRSQSLRMSRDKERARGKKV